MASNYRHDIAEIEYYKELFVSSFNSNQLIKAGRDLYQEVLNLGYKSLDLKKYDKKNIKNFNWKCSTKKNSNTFSLYLLGLRHIFILSFTAKKLKENKYLCLADKFLSSFYKYLEGNKNKHNMTYNDHALAERIENLIYFYHISRTLGYKTKNQKELIKIVEESLNKLLDPKIYQIHHNHGIIADKACLIASYFLNNSKTKSNIERILNRLNNQINFSFHADGVHKENSFDYHISTLKLLLSCYNICKKINHNFSLKLKKNIKKSLTFIIYGIKPNGSKPLFGDSKSGKRETVSKFQSFPPTNSLFQNPLYKYVSSFGKNGQPPKKKSVHFPSGYVFMREHFNKKNYKSSTWLSFKAGYFTRIHKHQDDLSFTLFSKGYDILIDSGMAGYMPKDKFKDYMESIPAHNSIGIKNTPYSIANSNGEKFKILTFSENNNYDYVKASSKVYDDTTIYRHLYYFREKDIIIIRDEMISENIHDYVQYFNLSNETTLVDHSINQCTLDIGKSGYSANLYQLKKPDSVNLVHGIEEKEMSIISTGFGSYEPSKTLQFNKKGSSEEFITVIEIIKSENKDTCNHSVKYCNSNLLLGDTTLSLRKSVPVEFKGVNISTSQNHKITLENIGYKEANRKFSLYVFDAHNQKIIKKFPYTQKRFIRYRNKEKKDLLLLYYVSSIEGELLKGIIAKTKYNKDRTEIVKQYKDLHTPHVVPKPIKKTNKKFLFSLDIKYDYPFMISWWVYYNGANLKYERNNKSTMEYIFNKSGEYVVMCSVRDKLFGEFFFYQFDKIEIN